MTDKRREVVSRFSFYVACIATAFGLGNLWRFPYVTSDYGGGAFVFIYVLLAFFIGAPLLVAEISLSKYLYKQGITFHEFIKKNNSKLPKLLKPFLKLPFLLSFIVLSYYSILSGWSLYLIIETFLKMVTGSHQGLPNGFLGLRSSITVQMLLAVTHLGFVLYLAARGLRVGLERWMTYIMPFFLCFFIYVVFKVTWNTDIFKTIKYVLYPNFHMLNSKSLSFAFGHVLFTMSLGFCIFVTMSVYLPRYTSAGIVGVRLALVDTLTSIGVGVFFAPILFASQYQGEMSEALFRAFPIYIEKMNLSPFLTIGFFICIFIASVNVSIGLSEVIYYRYKNVKSLERQEAVVRLFITSTALIATFLFVDHYFQKIKNKGFIVFLDDLVVNFILPFSAIALSIFILKFVDKEFLTREVDTEEGTKKHKLYKYWRAFVLFLVPAVFLLGVFLRFKN